MLDTVTFLWAARSLTLISASASPFLQDIDNVLYLSAVSISEIAIKQGKGSLDFDWNDVVKGLATLRVEVLPYTDLHAHRMFGLPLHHKDPFDRQIIAQALAELMPVVTPDRFFQLYAGIEVLW